MKFAITGANKETGEDVNLVLTAISRHEAEQAAIHQGILVDTVKLLMEEKDTGAISMDDDDGKPIESDTGAWSTAPKGGTIVLGANSPSDSTHEGKPGEVKSSEKREGGAEYHIIMNQALYLLESAVNKHMADGWEPAGGLTVGISNNAMQYFQAMVRKKKPEGK